MPSEAEIVATWSAAWRSAFAWWNHHYRGQPLRRLPHYRTYLRVPLPLSVAFNVAATATVFNVDFSIEPAEEDFGQFDDEMCKVVATCGRGRTVVWTGRWSR